MNRSNIYFRRIEYILLIDASSVESVTSINEMKSNNSIFILFISTKNLNTFRIITSFFTKPKLPLLNLYFFY